MEKDLVKQITEAKQIIDTIEKIKRSSHSFIAWSSHPAVLMWKDHITLLKIYYNTMIDEAIKRRYKK